MLEVIQVTFERDTHHIPRAPTGVFIVYEEVDYERDRHTNTDFTQAHFVCN